MILVSPPLPLSSAVARVATHKQPRSNSSPLPHCAAHHSLVLKRDITQSGEMLRCSVATVYHQINLVAPPLRLLPSIPASHGTDTPCVNATAPSMRPPNASPHSLTHHSPHSPAHLIFPLAHVHVDDLFLFFCWLICIFTIIGHR